jgi:hypothetical protein
LHKSISIEYFYASIISLYNAMPLGMDLDPGLEQVCLRMLQICVCNITQIADLNRHVVLTSDVVNSSMKISKKLSRTCRIAVRSSNTWKAGRGICEQPVITVNEISVNVSDLWEVWVWVICETQQREILESRSA